MRWLVLLLLAGCTRTQLVPVLSEVDAAWQQAMTQRINAIVQCLPPAENACVDQVEKGGHR